MKYRFLTTLLPCIICVMATSQEIINPYAQLVFEGKEWHADGLTYRITGDTLIDGKQWKRLYSDYPWGDDSDTYLAAIRQEGQKVYTMAANYIIETHKEQ